MHDDPEQQRLDELIARVASAQASDAEREELEMYAAERPEIVERLRHAATKTALGEGWLARVEADRRLRQRESSPLAQLERSTGMGMLIAGVVLGLVGSPLAPIGWIGGVGMLTWSVVRVRLRTHKDDPYRDIEE